MDYRYWDSNAFLGWLAGETDKVPYCRPVLEAAQTGNLMIVTSALTIAEFTVAKRTTKDRSFSAPRRSKISFAIDGLSCAK